MWYKMIKFLKNELNVMVIKGKFVRLGHWEVEWGIQSTLCNDKIYDSSFQVWSVNSPLAPVLVCNGGTLKLEQLWVLSFINFAIRDPWTSSLLTQFLPGMVLKYEVGAAVGVAGFCIFWIKGNVTKMESMTFVGTKFYETLTWTRQFDLLLCKVCGQEIHRITIEEED